MKIEEMRELIVADAYRSACEELVRQARIEERKWIGEIMDGIVDKGLSSLSWRSTRKLIDSLKRGEMPEVRK